ncbi:MAG: hypothetical protein OEZ32_03890 [Nitrospinota bacterium]|nr:hypothetical protein [Nitrospinota bacterium]
MFKTPIFRINDVAKAIEKSYPVASKLVTLMENKGLAKELTGNKTNRVYTYKPYLDLFHS